MERINQFAFYELGQSFKELASINGDTHPARAFIPVIECRQALTSLLNGKPIPLGVSRTPAANLLNTVENIVKSRFSFEDGRLKYPEDGEKPIPVYYFDWFRDSLKAFETVFNEELREAATYYVPRRGIFYTPALVDAADETFPSEVAQYIPQKTRLEWRSAGRCLAFSILSASGFHVARAVEGTLDAYYETFCGAPPPPGRSWGHLLTDLEQPTLSPCPAEKTLSEIRQMKDDYRNPLMHPRVVLSEGDARMLFANGESLIIAMAQEIRDVAVTKGGVQPGLSLIQGGAGTP